METIDPKLNDLAQLVGKLLAAKPGQSEEAGTTPPDKQTGDTTPAGPSGPGLPGLSGLYSIMILKIVSRKFWTALGTLAALIANNQLNLGLTPDAQAVIAALAGLYIAVQAVLDHQAGQSGGQ